MKSILEYKISEFCVGNMVFGHCTVTLDTRKMLKFTVHLSLVMLLNGWKWEKIWKSGKLLINIPLIQMLNYFIG